MGNPDTKAASFTDVPANASYAKTVNWSVEQGIANGASPTTFSSGQHLHERSDRDLPVPRFCGTISSRTAPRRKSGAGLILLTDICLTTPWISHSNHGNKERRREMF